MHRNIIGNIKFHMSMEWPKPKWVIYIPVQLKYLMVNLERSSSDNECIACIQWLSCSAAALTAQPCRQWHANIECNPPPFFFREIQWKIHLNPLFFSDIDFRFQSPRDPGGRLNKKDGLTRYGDSHVKDKTS